MTGVFEFGQQLRAAFCRETSELPDLWTQNNPSTGQCHVSALLLHIRYGGEILEGEHLLAQRRTLHYWNVIDGITIDITRDQFPPWVQLSYVTNALPPNKTTIAKADLLRRLAGIDRESAA